MFILGSDWSRHQTCKLVHFNYGLSEKLKSNSSMKPFPPSEITILGCKIFDDLMIKNSFKVYLVVGGVQGLNAPGNTAETLIDSDSGPYEWKTIEPLPISTYGLKAVHYENTVLTFGKNTCHTFLCSKHLVKNVGIFCILHKSRNFNKYLFS